MLELQTPSSGAYGFFGPRRGLRLDHGTRRVLAQRLRRPEVSPRLRERFAQAVRRVQSTVAAPGKASDAADDLGHRLLSRISFGWTLLDQQRYEALGYRAYVEEQLEPEAIDDFGLEAAITEALPTTAMTPLEIAAQYGDALEIPIFELMIAAMIRAAYSPRQLFERVVGFWSDHFNIDVLSDLSPFFKPADDRTVVRAHAMGRFPTLLSASAHSPAMLAYLTNDTNVVGRANENYARELMELHTLGVDAGYTQTDVREVARCFTGWDSGGYDPNTFGTFRFVPANHDDGVKVVLGRTIPAGGGVEDGETVLGLLAAHPSTARLVARKLLVRFWGYQPDARTIDRVASVYGESGGDIKAMLRVVFRWYRTAVATPKLRRPQYQAISAIRALFGTIENPFLLLESLLATGHLPFNWAPPNGYPDSEGYWSGLLLPRWNWGARLAHPEASGVAVDLSYLDPGMPPEDIVGTLDAVLLNRTMGAATRNALSTFLARREVTPETIRETVGLVVASPEFQRY